MKPAILLVLFPGALVGCATPEARQRQENVRHVQYLEAQARLITVSHDGPSQNLQAIPL